MNPASRCLEECQGIFNLRVSLRERNWLDAATATFSIPTSAWTEPRLDSRPVFKPHATMAGSTETGKLAVLFHVPHSLRGQQAKKVSQVHPLELAEGLQDAGSCHLPSYSLNGSRLVLGGSREPACGRFACSSFERSWKTA